VEGKKMNDYRKKIKVAVNDIAALVVQLGGDAPGVDVEASDLMQIDRELIALQSVALERVRVNDVLRSAILFESIDNARDALARLAGEE
jgi:hypothetical protein